jgi:hypothetical protein
MSKGTAATTENILLSISDAATRIETGTDLGYEIIDDWLRLHFCRELGRDCPATLLKNIDDISARSIFLDENLSRRSMSKRVKFEIAIQMRDKMGSSYSTIAKRLCVHPMTVYSWFREKKPPADKKAPTRFLQKEYNALGTIRRLVKFKLTGFGPLRTALREDAIREMSDLQDRALELSNLLRESIKELNAVPPAYGEPEYAAGMSFRHNEKRHEQRAV